MSEQTDDQIALAALRSSYQADMVNIADNKATLAAEYALLNKRFAAAQARISELEKNAEKPD